MRSRLLPMMEKGCHMGRVWDNWGMQSTIRDTAPFVSAVDRSTATTTRLYFLDHLRATIILLVILLHASMTYMAFAPPWWYVIEPDGSLFFTALVLVLDVPNMLILFFIAGFFAYPSLVKYGAGGFVRQKLVRIGLPWVVGVVFLAPLVSYLIPVTRGTATTYLDFWTGAFWGPYYQQSVYWFLGMLLLLFAILALAYRVWPRLRDLPRSPVAPSPALLLAFWALMSLWMLAVTLVVPADTWSNAFRIVVYQPARLLLYVGYFVLGILADRRGWLRPGGYEPALDTWLPAAAIAGVSYLGFRLMFPGGGIVYLAAQAALFNAFCLSALLGGLALFRRVAGQPTAVWNSLSRNAYAIYYLHPLVLYPRRMWRFPLMRPMRWKWWRSRSLRRWSAGLLGRSS